MQHSEQLDTRLWLAADNHRAVGMLLQKLPTTGGHAGPDIDTDTWDRVCSLGGTLKAEEMLATNAETLLHRLFWEEKVHAVDTAATRFACSCSRDKVSGMLTMLGRDEVESILAEKGEVDVHCEFCNERYVFDPVDAAMLFAASSPSSIAPASDLRH
jgi:molecular chaperone Hsp33